MPGHELAIVLVHRFDGFQKFVVESEESLVHHRGAITHVDSRFGEIVTQGQGNLGHRGGVGPDVRVTIGVFVARILLGALDHIDVIAGLEDANSAVTRRIDRLVQRLLQMQTVDHHDVGVRQGLDLLG